MEASRDQIRGVLLAANRCLQDSKCKAADVLLVLGPYLECAGVTGVSKWASAGGIGLVHALAGDAYRKERNFEVAAQWYRRASENGVAHAVFYARVVCEAKLVEHYADALATVERQRLEHRRRPWIDKIFFPLGMAHVLLDSDWWHYKLREKGDYEFLKSAVEQKKG